MNTKGPVWGHTLSKDSGMQAAPDTSSLTDRNFQNLISRPWIPDRSVCQHLAFLRHSGQHLFVSKSSFSQASPLIAATFEFPHILGLFHTFQSVIQFQASILFSFPLICWPNIILQRIIIITAAITPFHTVITMIIITNAIISKETWMPRLPVMSSTWLDVLVRCQCSWEYSQRPYRKLSSFDFYSSVCAHVCTHVLVYIHRSLCFLGTKGTPSDLGGNSRDFLGRSDSSHMYDLYQSLDITRSCINVLKIKPLLSHHLFLLNPPKCVFLLIPGTCRNLTQRDIADVIAWSQLWAWSYGVSQRVRFNPV